MNRENTRSVMVGNVQIGGQNKVVIQSMCNTKTKDVEATVKQTLELEKAGCEIIRVACLDIEDAKAIKEIKKQIHIPIVADIHFDYKIALQAIESGVDKVRINPGNIGSEDKVKAVVDKCKEKHIPIRIGVNAGSLEKDLLEKVDKNRCIIFVNKDDLEKKIVLDTNIPVVYGNTRFIDGINTLKEKIIDYLWLISILYGISSSAYWFPYNMFVINKIDNKNRTEYTVKSKNVSATIGILCPIILGSMITVTNYQLTALIILVISLVQIILSFLLTPIEDSKLSKFNLRKTWNNIKNNKQVRKMFLVEYLIGMSISDGALEIVMTILIFNTFKTDTKEEHDIIKEYCSTLNVPCLSTNFYQDGPKNSKEIANKIVEMTHEKNNKYFDAYNLEDPILEKINKMCINVFNAKEVIYKEGIKEKVLELGKKYPNYPICISKTPMSITDNKDIKKAPKDFTMTITNVSLSRGAGFIIIYMGNVLTMPGLTKNANYPNIDYKNGEVIGLF